MRENNRWRKVVGHRPCIYPCSGYPILKTIPDGPYVAAHKLPRFLQCSECGCAPLPKFQPELIERYLQYTETDCPEPDPKCAYCLEFKQAVWRRVSSFLPLPHLARGPLDALDIVLDELRQRRTKGT